MFQDFTIDGAKYLSKYDGSELDIYKKRKYKGIILDRGYNRTIFSIPTAIKVYNKDPIYYNVSYLLDINSPFSSLTEEAYEFLAKDI